MTSGGLTTTAPRERLGRLIGLTTSRKSLQTAEPVGAAGVVLGTLLAGLCWFIGSAFSTGPVCWTLWLVAALSATSAVVWGQVAKRASKSLPCSSGTARGWLRAAWATVLSSLALVAIVDWRAASIPELNQQLLVVIIDALAHAGLAVAVLWWAFYPARGHVVMLPSGLIAAGMAVAAGGVSVSAVAQTAFALTTVSGFVIASHLILSWDGTDACARSWSRLRSGGGKLPLTLLFGLLVLTLTSALTHWMTVGLPSLQSRFYSYLQLQLEESAEFFSDSSRYVSGRRLGNILYTLRKNPRAVALRGYSDRPPGYLRGEVFDTYEWGRWDSERTWTVQELGGRTASYAARRLRHVGEARTVFSQQDSATRFRFLIDGRPDTDRSDKGQSDKGQSDGGRPVAFVELLGDPNKGNTVFLPLQTRWVEAASQEIAVTPHGEISGGIDLEVSYVAGVTNRPSQEVLREEDRALLLAVDTSLAKTLQPLAGRLCRGATTAREKAARVANYFQSEYLYSLDPTPVPRNRDPVEYFLATRHPAHCEYFASATAVLLRQVGVPTRYVTGYVMDELSDNEDYFLARNRDAHAWVEYYDDRSRSWRAVESTPGRSVQMLEAGEVQDRLTDSAGGSSDSDDGRQGGWLHSILLGWFHGRATEALVVAFRILQAGILFALTVWLLRRRRTRNASDAGAVEDAKLLRQRRRMDRRLGRWGWKRRSSETLHQFASRLQSAATQLQPVQPSRADDLRQAADWYRQHAVTRYRDTLSVP